VNKKIRTFLIIILSAFCPFFAMASDISGDVCLSVNEINSQKIVDFKGAYIGVPLVSPDLISPQLPEDIRTLSDGTKVRLGRAYDVDTFGVKTESFGMGEMRFSHQKEILLYTSGICDCIGISVWDSATQTACLYHASKMELREKKRLFLENIDSIKAEFSGETSDLKVFLASCFLSRDLAEVVDLLQKNGFVVSGLFVPAVLLGEWEQLANGNFKQKTYYFDEETMLSSKNQRNLVMTINGSTGKTGVYPSWI
jgi:hypothetical protein